jgi:hypothetical protein
MSRRLRFNITSCGSVNIGSRVAQVQHFALALALGLFLTTPWPRQVVWCQELGIEQLSVVSLHDSFAQIGSKVPAFGGAFVDSDKDTVFAYMVPGQAGTAAELRSAIREVLGSAAPLQHNFAALQGQYTFLQLWDWCGLVTRYVLPMDGVSLTGIDDTHNRLIIGLETHAAASAVEAEMSLLGIPAGAFDIRYTGPAKAEGSLEDRIRPLYGGLEIERDDVPGYNEAPICSLGVIALRQGKAGFITASHCGDKPFTATGTIFTQPLNKARNPKVATEMLNPPLLNNLSCGRDKTITCPPEMNDKRPCRCSDSLFAEVTNPGLSNMLGYIARPDVGKLTWAGGDDPPPTFTITNKNGAFMAGQAITKVGAGDGRTEGKIQLACTFDKFTYTKGDDTIKLYVLCVNEATYSSTEGDSGGPVFVITNADKNQVTLTGLHTGSFDDMSVYSTIDQIEKRDSELGPLIVCADESC